MTTTDTGSIAGGFVHRVAVRFADVDAMGHAHHSLPLIYFEEARAAWWREITGRSELAAIDYIIAEFNVQYRGRILYPGELTVSLSVTRVGNSSFELEYELCDAAGAVLTLGRSVQVMFDYEGGRSKPIPGELRTRIEQAHRAKQPN